MTKKFTEEQFNKLVKIQESQYREDLFPNPTTSVDQISRIVAKTEANLRIFIEQNYLGNEAVALMNPLTREWAHDKFVEKEKKYVWTSKKPVTRNGNGFEIYKRLYRTLNGDISDVLKGKNEYVYEEEYLTETDIRAWGYNPEMFDKEAVEG